MLPWQQHFSNKIHENKIVDHTIPSVFDQLIGNLVHGSIVICRSARHLFYQCREMRCHRKNILKIKFMQKTCTVGYYFYVGRALLAGVLLITESDISS